LKTKIEQFSGESREKIILTPNSIANGISKLGTQNFTLSMSRDNLPNFTTHKTFPLTDNQKRRRGKPVKRSIFKEGN